MVVPVSNANGCDSVVNLALTVNPVYNVDISETIAPAGTSTGAVVGAATQGIPNARILKTNDGGQTWVVQSCCLHWWKPAAE